MKCRKRNFKTKAQAEKAIPQIKVLNMSRGRREKDNKSLHAYICDECNAWHVGRLSRYKWANA